MTSMAMPEQGRSWTKRQSRNEVADNLWRSI
jgi:hypothetical protein